MPNTKYVDNYSDCSDYQIDELKDILNLDTDNAIRFCSLIPRIISNHESEEERRRMDDE